VRKKERGEGKMRQERARKEEGGKRREGKKGWEKGGKG